MHSRYKRWWQTCRSCATRFWSAGKKRKMQILRVERALKAVLKVSVSHFQPFLPWSSDEFATTHNLLGYCPNPPTTSEDYGHVDWVEHHVHNKPGCPRIIVEDATDSFIVTDLKSLTDYTFQIAAENSAGAPAKRLMIPDWQRLWHVATIAGIDMCVSVLLTLDAFVHELLVKLLVKLINFRRPRPPFAVVSRRLERVVRPQHKTNGTTGAKDTEPAHASAGHAPFCRCLTQIWLMGDGHGGVAAEVRPCNIFFWLELGACRFSWGPQRLQGSQNSSHLSYLSAFIFLFAWTWALALGIAAKVIQWQHPPFTDVPVGSFSFRHTTWLGSTW